jgi:hypothetical protein
LLNEQLLLEEALGVFVVAHMLNHTPVGCEWSSSHESCFASGKDPLVPISYKAE